jgi:hypothetical protein
METAPAPARPEKAVVVTQPRLLSHKNAAIYMGVSPRRLSQLVAEGTINVVRLTPGLRHYDRIALDKLVDNLASEKNLAKSDWK